MKVAIVAILLALAAAASVAAVSELQNPATGSASGHEIAGGEG